MASKVYREETLKPLKPNVPISMELKSQLVCSLGEPTGPVTLTVIETEKMFTVETEISPLPSIPVRETIQASSGGKLEPEPKP